MLGFSVSLEETVCQQFVVEVSSNYRVSRNSRRKNTAPGRRAEYLAGAYQRAQRRFWCVYLPLFFLGGVYAC